MTAVVTTSETLTIRPIRTDDASGLTTFHDTLSERSRYFRFFTFHDVLPEQEAIHLATVDGVDRMAYVAETQDRIVAVGRYDRDPADPQLAEVAFAVADELQGHGIGTHLLHCLAGHAARHGIGRFDAWVLPTNHRMLEMFHDVAGPLHCHFDQGVVHVEFDVASVAVSDHG